jgi:hypothetical protein
MHKDKFTLLPCRVRYEFRTYVPHHQLFKLHTFKGEARGGAVGRGSAVKAGRSRVRFPMESFKFFIYLILPAALWLWGRVSL